jgi:alpha-D-ribose 1-methylphosphonate 5-triphosphate synthase subunit PhnH
MTSQLPTVAPVAFADPVHDAQAVFRTVLDAMSRPGTILALEPALAGTPLPPVAAALMLTLADHETSVWLDAGLSARPEVAAYLRFATGTRIATDQSEATFALISAPATMPPLETFAQGTPEYPDRSTTLVLIVDRLDAKLGSDGLLLAGPGIETTARLRFEPMPRTLSIELEANRARFPRGVDLIICAPAAIAAIPRSARLVGAQH